MKEITTKSQFDSILAANAKVIVKFYTTWCGPCKLLKVQYEKASIEETKVLFCELDAEKCSEVANIFKISTVPTVILFENGEVARSFEGFRTAQAITDFITNG